MLFGERRQRDQEFFYRADEQIVYGGTSGLLQERLITAIEKSSYVFSINQFFERLDHSDAFLKGGSRCAVGLWRNGKFTHCSARVHKANVSALKIGPLVDFDKVTSSYLTCFVIDKLAVLDVFGRKKKVARVFLIFTISVFSIRNKLCNFVEPAPDPF